MSDIWFTSDTHFGHENIITYCNRPFADVIDMNNCLVREWNRVVATTDTVYHLGDFGFGSSKTMCHIIQSLNGQIHLIKGNHDYRWNAEPFKYFTSVSDLKEIHLDSQRIVLCHYPLLSWNKSFQGSWSLHGHSHGNLPYDATFKRLDVGVDVHNFSPINFSTVREIFQTDDYQYQTRFK